jgi:hypothetical protein
MFFPGFPASRLISATRLDGHALKTDIQKGDTKNVTGKDRTLP